VSIGRAIVREPRVFLMDEPLSNLDAKLRESLRVELKHIQKTQNSTTVFVTHDQIEALTMADRIAVLDEGHILQIGTPFDIYDRPATTAVAQLVGTPKINLLPTVRQNGSLVVQNSTVQINTPAGGVPEEVLLGVRPEDVKLTENGRFNGTVALIEPLGVETILHIQAGGQTLLSIVPGATTHRLNEAVRFDVSETHLHFFDAQGVRVQSG
ncbi:MAG: ABC transporter ATP-binding protein, partial [Anaerolineae bacterium]|nr:ABC transporter ATP-binding protein [Anaerolineae bacterium]